MPDWTIVRRPGSPILFFVCMLTVLAIGWGSDKVSCERANAIRGSLAITYRSSIARSLERATVDHGLARRLDEQNASAQREALRRVTPLDCSSLLPAQ